MKFSSRGYNELAVYQQIKEAGSRLFDAQGYENTSVSDVIAKLQIREHEFYLYFKSKDELLEAIWSES